MTGHPMPSHRGEPGHRVAVSSCHCDIYREVFMSDHLYVTALLGAMGLCTIVGIYYIWVRKLGKPENAPVEPTRHQFQ